MTTAWCWQCGNEFTPVEYHPADLSEPNFDTPECEALYEAQTAYEEARYTGAPVN